MHEKDRSWEQMGAASGLLATLLFVIAFIVMLGTSPGGSPSLPNIQNASLAPAFIGQHLTAIRIVVMLSALGLVLFLWFLSTLWVTLREAEGPSARGTTAGVVGGVAGAGLELGGLALLATSGLSTSAAQANVVPTLYTGSSLFHALGAGVFCLFFFGVGRVVMHTGALRKWVGVLAYIAALLCVPAFLTPFFATNVLNPATGALGVVAPAAAFVIWVFLASGSMTLEERRRARSEPLQAPVIPQPVTEAEAAR